MLAVRDGAAGGGTRWILFGALVVLVPVPMLVFGGRVPTATFYLLSAVCTAVWCREGGAGPVRTLTLLLMAHALFYSGLFWAVAAGADRLLRRVPPRWRLACVLLPVAAAAAVGLTLPVYVTPFAPTPRSTLLEALR